MIEDLIKIIEKYMTEEEVAFVMKAYEYAKLMHKDLVLKDISVFGQNRNVIKLKFRTKLDNIMMAILFYKEDELKKDYEDEFNSDIYRDLASGKEIIMDICYNLRINEYMNNKNLEINVKHFRFRR